jgi:surfactin family lipopeptide synthetase A
METTEGSARELLPEELERALTQDWKEVFRLENVDRDDNFFELGGNSVLGMDLTERLASRLGIDVPVVVLFQHPTIRELVETLRASG